jgi:ABC-type uncharacterized transport system substrate-binding protein
MDRRTFLAGTGAVKEALPKLSRVAVLWDSSPPGVSGDLPIGVRRRESRAGRSLLVLPSPILAWSINPLVELAAKHRLPAMYQTREFVEAGGFVAYGTSSIYLLGRAALYVDKIFKGAKPADLPVEQPTKYELVINLKTAKALGLTIPPSLLGRADEVIQ